MAELVLEYNVPFESKSSLGGPFFIEGIAINETTTANNHKFLGEELQSSAKTLVGVPLLKDHNNSVDAIVGKVSSAHFNESTRNIPFKAEIKDPDMINKVKQGLINSVSVGAHVDPSNIEEGENGEIIPRGIVFKELSLVAIPADSGATFGVALNNAYEKFKSNSSEKIENTERGSTNMTEENTQVISETSEESFESKLMAKLDEMSNRLTKLEEADKDEAPAEAPAEEPKEEAKEPKEEAPAEPEEDADEEVEEEVSESALNILQKGNAFTYERKSYVYN